MRAKSQPPHAVRDVRTGLILHFKTRAAALAAAGAFAKANPWARPDLAADHPLQAPRWVVEGCESVR